MVGPNSRCPLGKVFGLENKSSINVPLPLPDFQSSLLLSPEKMWIQVFGEKPGPGPLEKTRALVSEVLGRSQGGNVPASEAEEEPGFCSL